MKKNNIFLLTLIIPLMLININIVKAEATSIEEWAEGFQDTLDDMSEKAEEASDQLSSGREQVENGNQAIEEGVNTMQEGVDKIAEGTERIAEGTERIRNNKEDMKSKGGMFTDEYAAGEYWIDANSTPRILCEKGTLDSIKEKLSSYERVCYYQVLCDKSSATMCYSSLRKITAYNLALYYTPFVEGTSIIRSSNEDGILNYTDRRTETGLGFKDQWIGVDHYEDVTYFEGNFIKEALYSSKYRNYNCPPAIFLTDLVYYHCGDSSCAEHHTIYTKYKVTSESSFIKDNDLLKVVDSNSYKFTLLENESKINKQTGNDPITCDPVHNGDDVIPDANCNDILTDDFRNELSKIMLYIRIAVPVLLIALGIVDFSKSLFAGKEEEMKKSQSRFVRRLIIGLVIFLLPTLINLIIDLVNIGWKNGLFGNSKCGLDI